MVVHHRRAGVVDEGHVVAVVADPRMQIAAHRQRELQGCVWHRRPAGGEHRRLAGESSRPLMHRVAVLQAAPIVDVPLGERVVPLIRHALACTALTPSLSRGEKGSDFDATRRCNRSWCTPAPVADQLQSPRPAARVGCGDEAAAIEARPPLLTGVPHLIPALHRVCGMAVSLMDRANAGPIRGRQPLGHAVVLGERGRERPQRHRRDRQPPARRRRAVAWRQHLT